MECFLIGTLWANFADLYFRAQITCSFASLDLSRSPPLDLLCLAIKAVTVARFH